MVSLTNISMERKKIMIKGWTIGDDSWGKINLANDLTMGSADAIPELPREKVKFEEDMTSYAISW